VDLWKKATNYIYDSKGKFAMETKLIMENWKKFNENPYQLMLEQYDRKVINETQLYERWEKEFDREFNQLEKELLILEQSIVDKAREVGQKIGQAVGKVKDKISDFVLEKTIQIMQMAKRAGFAALKAGAKIFEKVGKFCKNRPILCKILATLLLFLVMSVFLAPEAQAKLAAGGKPISIDKYNFIKGIAAKSQTFDTAEHFIRGVAELEKLQNAKELVDVNTLKGAAKVVYKLGTSELKDMISSIDSPDIPKEYKAQTINVIKSIMDFGSRTTAEIINDAPDAFRGVLKTAKAVTGK